MPCLQPKCPMIIPKIILTSALHSFSNIYVISSLKFPIWFFCIARQFSYFTVEATAPDIGCNSTLYTVLKLYPRYWSQIVFTTYRGVMKSLDIWPVFVVEATTSFRLIPYYKSRGNWVGFLNRPILYKIDLMITEARQRNYKLWTI